MQELRNLGFTDFFEQQIDKSSDPFTPARVTNVERGIYEVTSGAETFSAKLAGRFEFVALGPADYPCVGDWVLLRPGEQGTEQVIEKVLTRRSQLVRKRAGAESSAQIIAANVDYVFVVQSCNAEFNPRRLERYLVAVEKSGAQAVVVLNKSDLDPETSVDFATEHVHRVSASDGTNLEELDQYLQVGMTTVLVGSSGVGKSTLINRLCGGEKQKTQSVRADDDKGRHTTTSRQLLFASAGGMIIDTPGMREFGLLEADTEGSGLFDDISELVRSCRFSNCTHGNEPGCAVHAALADGSLEPGRLQSFEKLKREEAFHARKSDVQATSNAKKKWKQITKQMRDHPSKRRG